MARGTLDRRAEGIPKPIWEAAKAMHRVEAKRQYGKPGDGRFPKFKNLPEWAIRLYLADVEKIVRAYDKNAEKERIQHVLAMIDADNAEHLKHHVTRCGGEGDANCPGPDRCLTEWPEED